MKCPVCRATYHPPQAASQGHTPTCRRCGVDLAPLIRLHDQAMWHHRQAIQAFKAGEIEAAIAWNSQAIALSFKNADFHALEGQLWALQGKLGQAIAAWEKARQLNPQHPTAHAALQCFELSNRD